MNSRQNATLSTFNTKSSVLCPETRHITSQYLALEQLKAHHNMVSSAKGSVDTSAPKSLQSYLSSIDRKKKRYWQQRNQLSPQPITLDDLSHIHRYQRGAESRLTDENGNSTKDVMEEKDKHSTSLNKSIQAGIPYPRFSSKVADKISWYLEAVSQGEFQQSISKNHNLPHNNNIQPSNSVISLSSSLRSGKVVKGDLMDWHKNSFTAAERSFSPRILANNAAKSKLLGMRCYNPPRRRKERNSINSSDTFESYEDEEEEAEEEEEEEEEEQQDEIEEIKTDDSIEVKDEVPLKGSASHQDWLSEQALRAQIRRKLKTKGTGRRILPSHEYSISDSVVNPNPKRSNIFSRDDEEELHLKFLSDVTEDILRSGLYTDKAIQRTFDFHLQFYPKDTDKGKIQHLLNQVLEGLQVPSEESAELLTRGVSFPYSKDSNQQSSSPLGRNIVSNGLHQFTAPSTEEHTSEVMSGTSQQEVITTAEKVAENLDNMYQSEEEEVDETS